MYHHYFTSGIFNIPDTSNKEPTENAIPLTIICDNIREPGNLGAIVRCAAAVGCERLLLMKGNWHFDCLTSYFKILINFLCISY